MKTQLKLVVMLLVSSSLMLSSCKKDEEEDDSNTPDVATTFTAKIDGVQFTASTFGGLLDTDGGEIWIHGDNSNGTINIFFPDDVTTGTYNIGLGTGSTISLNYQPDGSTYYANPGTVVVTKHDVATHRIEGTFSATLSSTMPPNMALTDGEFKVTYMVGG